MPTPKKSAAGRRRTLKTVRWGGRLVLRYPGIPWEAVISEDGRYIVIGCQMLTPKQWLGGRGRALIRRYVEGWRLDRPARCGNPKCDVCDSMEARWRQELKKAKNGFTAKGRLAERLLVRLAKLAEKQRERYQAERTQRRAA
jgi:hypothetical protein